MAAAAGEAADAGRVRAARGPAAHPRHRVRLRRRRRQPAWRSDDADLRPGAERGGELQSRRSSSSPPSCFSSSLAALFCGDAVPSEASWASLRYLLIAPVRRARLLTSKARGRHQLDSARDRPAARVGAGRRRHRLRLGAADQPAWREPHLGPVPPTARPRHGPTSSSRCCRSPPSPSGSARGRTRRSPQSAAPCSSASSLNILDQLDALDPYRNAFPATTPAPGRTPWP